MASELVWLRGRRNPLDWRIWRVRDWPHPDSPMRCSSDPYPRIAAADSKGAREPSIFCFLCCGLDSVAAGVSQPTEVIHCLVLRGCLRVICLRGTEGRGDACIIMIDALALGVEKSSTCSIFGNRQSPHDA